MNAKTSQKYLQFWMKHRSATKRKKQIEPRRARRSRRKKSFFNPLSGLRVLRALRGEKAFRRMLLHRCEFSRLGERQYNRLRRMSVPSLCDGRGFRRSRRFLFLLLGTLSPLVEDIKE